MGFLQAGQYETLAQAATSAMQSSEAYTPFQRIMASGRRRAGGDGGRDPFSEWANMLNARMPEQPFQELARAMPARRTQMRQARQPARNAAQSILGAQRNTAATAMPTQSSVSSVISPGQTQVIRPSQQPQQARRQAPTASTDGSLLTGQDAMGMGSFMASSLLGG